MLHRQVKVDMGRVVARPDEGIVMYIGEIARRTGSSQKAIRHYESLGLLGQVTRIGSYRVYSEGDVALVHLIKQAQALGFRLSELGAVTQGAGGEPDWAGLARQIELKRHSVQAEIRRLRGIDQRLGEVDTEIRACLAGRSGGGGATADCEMPPGVAGSARPKAA